MRLLQLGAVLLKHLKAIPLNVIFTKHRGPVSWEEGNPKDNCQWTDTASLISIDTNQAFVMFHAPDSIEPPLSPYSLILALGQQSPIFLATGTSFVEAYFSRVQSWGGKSWFWDDSSALYWWCTLFLLLLHCDIKWNNYTIHHNSKSVGALSLFSCNKRGCKYGWSFTHSPAAHLLLCGPIPNRTPALIDSTQSPLCKSKLNSSWALCPASIAYCWSKSVPLAL